MNRLAIRDQENLIHTHQNVATVKQTNQNLRPLGAKTPVTKVPKTPVKLPLNNENAPLRTGRSVLKTAGKGNENITVKGTGKGNPEKKQPCTPKGLPNRAPLGNKTTNAKAKAYQTPAQWKTDSRAISQTPKIRSRSPRLRRAKVKIFQPALMITKDDDSEPDIEYMPPKPKYLPDLPDDLFPAEMSYTQLKGPNLTRGWYETYSNPIEDDGRRRAERLQTEEAKRISWEQDEVLRKSCENISLLEGEIANDASYEELLDGLC